MTLPALERPPIFEVACGFEFDPIAEIDPVLLGGFWAAHKDEFPLRDTHPEIPSGRAGAVTLLHRVPLRTWLLSANGEFVAQIQKDRFFLNWRWIGEEGRYPRFSSTPDGVLHRSLRLFRELSAFLRDSVGKTPQVHQVEVLKVDVLMEGPHWNGDHDLAVMMPALGPLTALGGDKTQAGFRWSQDNDGGRYDIVLETQPVTPKARHLRLSTTVRRPATHETLEVEARRAGQEANRLFGALIPEGERNRRFGPLTQKERP